MTKKRLEELLKNVLEWGSEHNEEFRYHLITQMGLTKKEYEELKLNEDDYLEDLYQEVYGSDNEMPWDYSGHFDKESE